MNFAEKSNTKKAAQTPIFDRQVTTELASDVILPDYQPEMKKLLWVQTKISPVESYLSASSGDFSGTAEYRILYVGNDDSLYCTTEKEDFRFQIPLDFPTDVDASDGLFAEVFTEADGVSGRATAPRKISVRGRLRSKVQVFGYGTVRTFSEDENLERLMGSLSTAERFFGRSDVIQLTDEIPLEDGGEYRVISADGRVLLTDVSAGSGYVNCQGQLQIKLLAAKEGSEELPSVLIREIPISGSVPTDGAEVNCLSGARGFCQDLRVTVEEGRILCEADVELRTVAERNEEIPYVKDAFLPYAKSESRFAERTFPELLKMGSGNFTVSAGELLSDLGLHEGARILDAEFLPTVTGMETDEDRFFLVGKCRCNLLAKEENEYVTVGFDIPFRYETSGETKDAPEYSASLEVLSSHLQSEKEKIEVRAELAVSYAVHGENTVRMHAESLPGEPIAKDVSVMKICYPAKGETLWNVAKRYALPVAEFSKKNSLPDAPLADSPASLEGVDFLLI